MLDFFGAFTSGAVQFGWRDVIDIIIVAIIIYALIRITHGTRALQVIKGFGVIIVICVFFSVLNLQTVSWILNYLLSAGAILIVILFQPEIRRALEKIGGGKIFSLNSQSLNVHDSVKEEIIKACLNMSKHGVGALIVFDRKTGLKDIIETGTTINAEISQEMIETVFFPKTLLHDGAMIIRGDKIIAAGCFLPLSDNKQISSELGTRHRAALGVSEVSDSYVIVVSEETGDLSYTHDGHLTRGIDVKVLRDLLDSVYSTDDAEIKPPSFYRFKRRVGK